VGGWVGGGGIGGLVTTHHLQLHVTALQQRVHQLQGHGLPTRKTGLEHLALAPQAKHPLYTSKHKGPGTKVAEWQGLGCAFTEPGKSKRHTRRHAFKFNPEGWPSPLVVDKRRTSPPRPRAYTPVPQQPARWREESSVVTWA
jgi:hypothetical protein